MPKLLESWQQSRVLEAVFDHLSDALVLYDTDMQITGMNRAAEQMFGMSAEEMVGTHCREMFNCGPCEAGCGIQLGSSQLSLANGTVRLRTAGNLERLAVIRTEQIFDHDGELQGTVATVKDITDEFLPQKRDMVAESQSMRDIALFLKRVAASEAATVLIEGENGTGKDMVAKTIHSLLEHAPDGAVYRYKLRGNSRYTARERTVRLRERRLHRRPVAEARPVRTGG